MIKKKILLSIIIAIFVSSCSILDPDEDIPTYIKIDSLSFYTNAYKQGAATHKITDVWINIDGNFLGTYELPITFPVLATGEHTIRVRPGIKDNGIDASRAVYPFYESHLIDTFLDEKQEMHIIPGFTYNESAIFEWIEDFQDPSLSLERLSNSDTLLIQEVDTSLTNNKWGAIYLDNEHQGFEYITTGNAFEVRSTDTYIELDYKNNQAFTIGILLVYNSEVEDVDIIQINPSEVKNKIYIDLSYVLSQSSTASGFYIYIRAAKNSDIEKAEIFIDNLKLVRF